MLGHGRSFAAEQPEAWNSMTAGEKGQFRTADGLFTYRGADADLIVMAHVTPEVLEEQSAGMLRRLLLLYGAILVILLPLAWYLAYVRHTSRRARKEQQLKESEERACGPRFRPGSSQLRKRNGVASRATCTTSWARWSRR